MVVKRRQPGSAPLRPVGLVVTHMALGLGFFPRGEVIWVKLQVRAGTAPGAVGCPVEPNFARRA